MYLLFVFLFLPCVSDAEIWIKAPHIKQHEFKAHVLSLEKDNITYAQHLLKQQRKLTKLLDLENKIAKAQKYYLSGEMQSALKSFKEIISMSFDADWTEEQKRGILYSYLRLAQKEENESKQRAHLISASQFIIDEINSENYPDYKLFPPPLFKELEKIQKSKMFLVINWKNIFPDHEIILLNGKRINPEQDLKIPDGFYRVTALSSSHKPWIKKISLSYLSNQKIKTTRLTSGYCESLKINSYIKNSNMKLFNQDCPKINPLNVSDKNYSKELKKNNKDLKTLIKENKLPILITGALLITGSVFSYYKFKNSNNSESTDSVPF